MDTPPAISLVISDPTAGATILADRVTVRGTIAGPANVGVSVNGVTAVVSGNVFSAADVPLTTGQNIATATAAVPADRKSTRLNSSHITISYAVFCLKKKKKQKKNTNKYK